MTGDLIFDRTTAKGRRPGTVVEARMAEKAFRSFLILIICILYQCSRTCGEGVRYRQVDCLQKLANGTEVQSTECNIEDVQRLMEPCHSQPCGMKNSLFSILFSGINLIKWLKRAASCPQEDNRFSVYTITCFFLSKTVFPL